MAIKIYNYGNDHDLNTMHLQVLNLIKKSTKPVGVHLQDVYKAFSHEPQHKLK